MTHIGMFLGVSSWGFCGSEGARRHTNRHIKREIEETLYCQQEENTGKSRCVMRGRT